MLPIYDYIIIGSGFGGSVSAMRLAEKSYSVLCIEQGKRFKSEDYAKSNWDFRKYLWWPAMGMYGIQKLSFFRQASILTGTGVGGGSLVYANTLFYPGPKFFKSGSWAEIKDWEKELKPFYDEAGIMMGRTKLAKLHYEDTILRNVAGKMGRADSFDNVYVAVNLDEEKQDKDPYFGGLGPVRNVCTYCAGCMVGCRENAKNTLDKNYLFFAEKFGAEILPETKVFRIDFSDGIYSVRTRNIKTGRNEKVYKSNNLIISSGTLGTLKLLLKQKFKYKSLPGISDRLGDNLLTNSETLSAVSFADRKMNNGLAISSVFHPDDNTHIEIVKYPDGSNALKWFFSLAASGAKNSFIRTLKLAAIMISRPLKTMKIYLKKNWSEKLVIFLVMQDLENSMKMIWSKSAFGGKMKIVNKGNKKVPAYIPIGQEVMERYAKEVNGIPQNIILEIMYNRPTTAHILGGCLMGKDQTSAVVNDKLEVFNYPGMYIIDGSVIQSNPGVNPSYSILAMAEYAMSKIPTKDKSRKNLRELIAENQNVGINSEAG